MFNNNNNNNHNNNDNNNNRDVFLLLRCDLSCRFRFLMQDEASTFLGASGVPGLFYATIGPAESVYVPPGWVFCEICALSGVNYGLTLPLFISGDCLASVEYVD